MPLVFYIFYKIRFLSHFFLLNKRFFCELAGELFGARMSGTTNQVFFDLGQSQNFVKRCCISNCSQPFYRPQNNQHK